MDVSTLQCKTDKFTEWTDKWLLTLMEVMANNINLFKKRLDKLWSSLIMFIYLELMQPLGTGSDFVIELIWISCILIFRTSRNRGLRPASVILIELHCIACMLILQLLTAMNKQESRAVARKTRNAAAVLFGLKFADNIYYKFKSSQASKARLYSSKHTGAKQNLTQRQNGHSRSFKVTCFGVSGKAIRG